MLFKKNVLSSSVAVALVGSTMPSFSQAQELEIEEVIVEGGIRASLKKSMDLKRDTVGVADAISAEDMGKFPDTNLAEALQRITGVSIDRSRGEGNKVTVRGFGPDYNMVTLNGRQMPTHSGISRAFSFGDIASEGIQAVIVKKTGDAAVPTGGIGAHIDIVTTKPLEAGYVRTFGAKAAIDTSVVTGKNFTPELAGLISDTFADDTVGLSLSFSLQERNNAERFANVGGWNTSHATSFDNRLSVPADIVDGNVEDRQINRPDCEGVSYEDGCMKSISIPQSLAYNLSEYVSDRVNSQLTFQYRPLEALTATVDYTYSQMEVDRNYNDLSAWFSGQQSSSQSAEWDYSDDPIGSPLVYREVDNGHPDEDDFAMGIGHDGSINTNNSLGLNLELFATDRLRLEFDYHDSTAESKANGPFGTSSLVTLASFNRTVSKVYFTEDLPILELGLNPQDPRTVAEGGDHRPLYADDMIITGSVFGNGLNKMNIEQFRFKGTYDASDMTSIDFGLEMAEVSNRTRSSVVERGTWGGISDPGYISDILDLTSMEDNFDSISGGDYQLRQVESFYTTLEDVVAKARLLPVTADDADIPRGSCVPEPYVNLYCASDVWTVDKATTEETSVVFIKATHDTMAMNFPVNISAGLRYEETVVKSVATVPDYKETTWAGGNEITLVADEGVTAEEYNGGYDLLLPNLDIQVELNDDLVGRFSASKTVTRPNYEDIKGGVTANGTSFKQNAYEASSGNPGLEPIKSFNLDFSLEWYYGDADYVSIGLFTKDVENFIGSTTETMELWGVRDVLSGGEFQRVIDLRNLEDGDLSGVKQYLNTSPNNKLVSDNDNDYAQFSVSMPVNKDDAKVEGVELNIQHNFGETGFGVIANATFVDANVAYVPEDIFKEDQFALSGLSDSANLIGYYDKDGFNIRFAYNWRDDFFNGIGQSQGHVFNNDKEKAGVNVTNTEAYGQLDMSASYEFSDNLTVFMDGLNVTDSTYRTYGREKLQVLRAGQTGPRYNIGFRYTF